MQQDDSARTITAAERVIAIPELRQDIMSRLSRKEVAIMMRSSKMLFGDAVAVVYASIIDKEVEKMTRKTVRTLFLPIRPGQDRTQAGRDVGILGVLTECSRSDSVSTATPFVMSSSASIFPTGISPSALWVARLNLRLQPSAKLSGRTTRFESLGSFDTSAPDSPISSPCRGVRNQLSRLGSSGSTAHPLWRERSK